MEELIKSQISDFLNKNNIEFSDIIVKSNGNNEFDIDVIYPINIIKIEGKLEL